MVQILYIIPWAISYCLPYLSRLNPYPPETIHICPSPKDEGICGWSREDMDSEGRYGRQYDNGTWDYLFIPHLNGHYFGQADGFKQPCLHHNIQECQTLQLHCYIVILLHFCGKLIVKNMAGIFKSFTHFLFKKE